MEKPELSVILVSFNNKLHLPKCLRSLEMNAQDIDFELIVIDNNSSDGSQEFIEKNFPQVRLVRNSENVGYARANNQGIRASKGKYVLLLNTDTVVTPHALDLLCEELKADSDVGGVGPALLLGENRYQVSFGKKVSFLYEILQKCFSNPYQRLKLKTDQKKREVGWLSGACFLSKRDVLEEAGLFDENFFIYFEDIDLCLRIKEKGWRLIFLPQARIFHTGGASTSRHMLFSRFQYRKSQIYFYRKHNSRTSLFLLRAYLKINFFFLVFWGYLMQRKDTNVRKSFFRLLEREKNEKN